MNLWQSFSADEKNVSWWSFQRRQKFSGIVVRLVLHYFSSILFFLISASFRFCSFAAACCDLCDWATVLVVRWGATAVVTTTNAPLLLSARHSHSVPSQYTKHSGAVRVHRVNLFNCSNSTLRLNCLDRDFEYAESGLFSCSFQYRNSAFWHRKKAKKIWGRAEFKLKNYCKNKLTLREPVKNVLADLAR